MVVQVSAIKRAFYDSCNWGSPKLRSSRWCCWKSWVVRDWKHPNQNVS